MRAPQNKRLDGDQGATMVEYCFMVALIAMVCFVAVQFLGGETNSGYSSFSTSLAAAS
jgi:Flp pilus assembly pilin Flp